MTKILIYTVHKAASMFLHTITGEVSEYLKINYFSINDEKYINEITGSSWADFIDNHNGPSVFGPIRVGAAEPSVPNNFEKYQALVHIRDPRDVLTSLYYSHVFSHKITNSYNPNKSTRETWKEKGIDDFVLKNSMEFKKRYQIITDDILKKENVILLKYEDMVADYERWLQRYLSIFVPFAPRTGFFRRKTNTKFINQIHNEIYNRHKDAFMVSAEDIYEHKRQVTPGDHKRKLKHETISQLNSDFDDTLHLLEYVE